METELHGIISFGASKWPLNNNHYVIECPLIPNLYYVYYVHCISDRENKHTVGCMYYNNCLCKPTILLRQEATGNIIVQLLYSTGICYC